MARSNETVSATENRIQLLLQEALPLLGEEALLGVLLRGTTSRKEVAAFLLQACTLPVTFLIDRAQHGVCRVSAKHDKAK